MGLHHDGTATSGMVGRDNIFTGGVANGIQSAGGQWSAFDHNAVEGGCPPANPCGAGNLTAPTFAVTPGP